MSDENTELLKCRPLSELNQALIRFDKIQYSNNGNRAQSVEQTLAWAQPIARRLGITRFANISYLDPAGINVVQCTRPSLEDHFSFGQNTVSQGKGTTFEQAAISAIMESIETYCLEPRGVDFIRGNYNYLKKSHAILNPSHLLLNPISSATLDNEEILWFKALHFETKEEVLIPAETVFFPLKYEDYNIDRHFICGSNGVASGFTYQEAINHALYELIERYYFSELQIFHEKLAIKLLPLEKISENSAFDFCRNSLGHLKLLSIGFNNKINIPFYLCLYSRDNRTVVGKSCGPNAKVAIQRAISEAVQVMCSLRSGAREDLANSDTDWPEKIKLAYQNYSPNLAKADLMSLVEVQEKLHQTNFTDFKSELDVLFNFLLDHGFKNVFIANLTRAGVEVPVVKVIIPNMPGEFRLRTTHSKKISTCNSNRLKYGII